MMTEILKLEQEEKNRLMNAVNSICIDNPDAIDQLEKLATIKQEKPLVWAMLLVKLKNF